MRCTSNTSLRPSRSPRPSRTWRTRRGRVGGSCCSADTPACSIGTRRRSTADAHVIMRPRAAQALFPNYLGARATGVLSAFSLRKSFIPSGRGTSSSLWRSLLETIVAPVPRPPSAVRIPWPFDRVREGQADFLADARLAIADGRHLLAHAPTGIGKTAVALVASLEYTLRANKLVLFLTSRQSPHRIAIPTVRRIEAKGPRIATVDLIAKQSMCLQESAPAYGRAFHEFCDHKVKSRTCGFFTRDNSAVVTAVLQRTLHVQELVRASGACGVCPHKVAMDAASRANLVVCDYNYLFSEILERFLPRLGRSLDDLGVVVDQGPKPPDRIRAHLGGDLSVHDLLKAAKEARSIDGEVAHRLVGGAKAIEHFLLVARAQRVAREEELLDLVEERLPQGRGR